MGRDRGGVRHDQPSADARQARPRPRRGGARDGGRRVHPAHPDPRPGAPARDRAGGAGAERVRGAGGGHRPRPAPGGARHPRHRRAAGVLRRGPAPGLAHAAARPRFVQPADGGPGGGGPVPRSGDTGARPARRRLLLVPEVPEAPRVRTGGGPPRLAGVPPRRGRDDRRRGRRRQGRRRQGRRRQGLGADRRTVHRPRPGRARRRVHQLRRGDAVDWDAPAACAGSAPCDLSAHLRTDLGRFTSRDELFARHGQTMCRPARTLAEPVLGRWSAGAGGGAPTRSAA